VNHRGAASPSGRYLGAKENCPICVSHSTVDGLCGTVDRQAQAKALRLRLYVLCSECARIIDLSDGNKPQRMIEADDLIRHEAEEHAYWLEVLGIDEI